MANAKHVDMHVCMHVGFTCWQESEAACITVIHVLCIGIIYTCVHVHVHVYTFLAHCYVVANVYKVLYM